MLQLVEVNTGVLQELDGGSIVGICLEIKLEIELPDWVLAYKVAVLVF